MKRSERGGGSYREINKNKEERLRYVPLPPSPEYFFFFLLVKIVKVPTLSKNDATCRFYHCSCKVHSVCYIYLCYSLIRYTCRKINIKSEICVRYFLEYYS